MIENIFNTDRDQFQIPVVFDVNGPDREASAQYLCDKLAEAELAQPNSTANTHVESWWFANQQDKSIDGNDNDAFLMLNTTQETESGFVSMETVLSWSKAEVDD